jgi:23S rRNA (cytidine1920-2'-O)/16S rRNA (cytidine1409-2'-O)-methyltransferase
MKKKAGRKRIDTLLVERELCDSLAKAQAVVLAGEVFADGKRVDKPGVTLPEDTRIELNTRSQKYVSRGGLKLEGALADFSVDPLGLTCLDVGSSTGGFTDCLLQHGATKVYSVDVSVSQLDWKLRQNARVVCVEQNARALAREHVPDPVDLVTVDVSFISAGKVLAPAAALAKPEARFVILVKPQFELPKQDVDTGGIVTDKALHEKAIELVRRAALAADLQILGTHPSRLKGAEGNQEYFLYARKSP